MSSSADNITVRRPHDAEASRQALLEAARSVFDEVGYERATTREIGERAGVDPALIARYFEGKEGLFLAALADAADEEIEFEPGALLAFLLERWEERGHSPISRALASPALTDDVREQVRTLVRERLLRRLTETLAERGAPEPRLRAEVLIALAVGVAVTRANGTLEELAACPREHLLDLLGPPVEALAATGPGG
jgi:AcrR family transcriptional regulator